MPKKKPFFSGTQPCKSCPYRKDAPLALWDKSEFDSLLVEDKMQFGKTFKCHKNDGSCCKGWLINQENRGLPNINLRMQLFKAGITREYLESLTCKVPMFETIEEMAEANFPTKKTNEK
jgi:hypothetical protein